MWLFSAAVATCPGGENLRTAECRAHSKGPRYRGVCRQRCRQAVQTRRAVLGNAGLLVHGTAERRDGAVNLVATRLTPLVLAPGTRSRDFR